MSNTHLEFEVDVAGGSQALACLQLLARHKRSVAAQLRIRVGVLDLVAVRAQAVIEAVREVLARVAEPIVVARARPRQARLMLRRGQVPFM